MQTLRKIWLFAFALSIIVPISAQQSFKLTKGMPTQIYSLPKTKFCIELEIEKTTKTQGQFYQYAQKYLVAENVITENKTQYSLKNISLSTSSVADPKRTYNVDMVKGTINNLIVLNSKGIFCGINVLPVIEKIETKTIKQLTKTERFSNSLLPLGEEYLMAGSTAKLAEGVARQIYRIRESKMLLLSGDMDKLPSDGASLSTMLQGLENTEQYLTEMFIGKTTIEKQVLHLYYTPEKAVNNEVLFRISALKGLVDADDLSGEPYYINIVPSEIVLSDPDPKAKIEKTTFNTILPASTEITITNGNKTLYNNTLDIPQLGVIVPLSDKISNQQRVKIEIDPSTGRLLSVSK